MSDISCFSGERLKAPWASCFKNVSYVTGISISYGRLYLYLISHDGLTKLIDEFMNMVFVL